MGWEDTSMVQSIWTLPASVTTAVSDMLRDNRSGLKLMYRNPRPCPLLFHSCTQVPSFLGDEAR